MLLNLDRQDPSSICAVDDLGHETTYGELMADARLIAGHVPPRSLVYAFCENSMPSLAGYVAFLANGIVPLLLDRDLDEGMRGKLIETYRPAYLWMPGDIAVQGCERVFCLGSYDLLRTGLRPYPLHEDLALLITTSGSTGSPKLVRQTYRNIESNARSISEYLGIDATERPITTLPMNYVYGASVINSHLSSGATILLTTKGVVQREFWSFFRDRSATSLAGVPYTYEILKRLRFFRMDLPSLRTMTQAGGKLLPELHREFAQYAEERGKKFIVMYGAAEATARMGYLPPDRALEKCGSMGFAIPGGRFSIVDESGRELEGPNVDGELVYYGDNVTPGYAECGEDLARGDDRLGRLETGDMVRRDEDGFYYVIGRKKRFLKIFGNRVGLDEMENLIKSRFPGIECACCGVDDRMHVFITDGSFAGDILAFAADATSLNRSAFIVTTVPEIPKNESGKIRYADLEGMCPAT